MDGVDEIGSHVFQAGAVEGVEGHGVVHENFAKKSIRASGNHAVFSETEVLKTKTIS